MCELTSTLVISRFPSQEPSFDFIGNVSSACLKQFRLFVRPKDLNIINFSSGCFESLSRCKSLTSLFLSVPFRFHLTRDGFRKVLLSCSNLQSLAMGPFELEVEDFSSPQTELTRTTNELDLSHIADIADILLELQYLRISVVACDSSQ